MQSRAARARETRRGESARAGTVARWRRLVLSAGGPTAGISGTSVSQAVGGRARGSAAAAPVSQV